MLCVPNFVVSKRFEGGSEHVSWKKEKTRRDFYFRPM